MKKTSRYGIRDLLGIMRTLRSPRGCPWDRQQTHASICSSLVEETYEFIDAVRSRKSGKMAEELGDLLLHVVFHAEIGRAKGEFGFDDVTDGICRKLIRRHPHVFGRARVRGAADVMKNWNAIKAAEKPERRSVMDRIPRSLPGFERAGHILRAAYKAGFRWSGRADLLAKVREELSELLVHCRTGRRTRRKELEEELGDLFFVLINLARDCGVDPERSVRKAGEKFVRRFGAVERVVRRSGRTFRQIPYAELKKIYIGEKRRLSHS